MGWRMLLQANGFMFYNDWPSMLQWLEYEGYHVFNEYSEGLTLKSFKRKVQQKQKDGSHSDDWRNHKSFSIIDGYEFADVEFC